MKNTTHHLIAAVPRWSDQADPTIDIDLGDVWSHHCTLNEDGEVVDRGRFRTTPKAIGKWVTDRLRHVWPRRLAFTRYLDHRATTGTGTRGDVANVRELRAISHSDRKSDQSRCGEACPLRTSRSEHLTADLTPYDRAAGSPDFDSYPRASGPTTHRVIVVLTWAVARDGCPNSLYRFVQH